MKNEKLKHLSKLDTIFDFKEIKKLKGELTAVQATPRVTRELSNAGSIYGFLKSRDENYMKFISQHDSINDLIVLADKEDKAATFKGIYDNSSNIYRIYGVAFGGMIRDGEDIYYGKINIEEK